MELNSQPIGSRGSKPRIPKFVGGGEQISSGGGKEVHGDMLTNICYLQLNN